MSEANRTRVIEAVADVVRDLELDGIKGVYTRNRDKQGATVQFPCIEIRRDDSPDREVKLTAEHDSVGYGVRIAFKFRDSNGPKAPAERSDNWHEVLCQKFRNRNSNTDGKGKLPGMPEVHEITIEPMAIGSVGRDTAMMVEGGLIVRVFVVEQRG